MPHTIPLTVRRALVVLSMGALGCSSGDLVLPESPGSAQSVALTKVDGDEQTGPVGETLTRPLVVRVVNEQQQAVIGLVVAFELSDSAAGTIDPPTATTNSTGEAIAHWTLGTMPGAYNVTARLVGVEGEDKVAEFHAAANPAAPDTLSPQVPLAQSGRREQTVDTPPMVRVVDRFGNPVPGVPVGWYVIAGEGRVSSPIVNTDADGKASVQWTLGNRIGVHKLTAVLESATISPVVFTAHVLF